MDPIFFLQPPAIIVNQALDSIGCSDQIIGDVTDGSMVGEAARRNYGQVLRQLLRTAHWPFARKMAVLTLLGDNTGQTPTVTTFVEQPWTYAYAWPIDAVQGRWLPFGYLQSANGVPSTPTGLPLTGSSIPLPTYPLAPGRFLVSSSDQYPIETGTIGWDQLPDLRRTEGLGPTNRKVILSDCPNAMFVYTRLVTVIEEWDDLFRQAMVALIGLMLAPVAIEDPKERLAQRNAMIGIAKNIIADARVAAGNEAGYPMSTDFEASWIQARNFGAGAAGWGGLGFGGFGGLGGWGGAGSCYCDWQSFSFCGSVF